MIRITLDEVLQNLGKYDAEAVIDGIRQAKELKDPLLCPYLIGLLDYANKGVVEETIATICSSNICEFHVGIDGILSKWDDWDESMQSYAITWIGGRMVKEYRKGNHHQSGISKFLEVLNGPPSILQIDVMEMCQGLTLDVMIEPLLRLMFSEERTETAIGNARQAFHTLKSFRTEEILLQLIKALHIHSYPPYPINGMFNGNCTPRVRQALIDRFAQGDIAFTLEEFLGELSEENRLALGLNKEN